MFRVARSMLRGKVAAASAGVLVLVVAGTTVAGTGLGGTFQLGVDNTVNGASTLLTTTFTGTTTTWATSLQVVNNATTGLSRTLYVLSKSPTAPAAVIQNTVGTALWLQGPAGKPPLIVSPGAGTATNLSADKLDGIDSTGFLPAQGTAANSAALGGSPPAAYWRGQMYVRSMVTNGSANVNSTCPEGAICFAGGYYCDTGDALLGGGFSEIDNGTRLVASEPFTPNPQDAWRVKFVNNSTEDTITVHTLCADFGAPHVP
jgi:hypothetical protein